MRFPITKSSDVIMDCIFKQVDKKIHKKRNCNDMKT